jgi:hypothetical protein
VCSDIIALKGRQAVIQMDLATAITYNVETHRTVPRLGWTNMHRRLAKRERNLAVGGEAPAYPLTHYDGKPMDWPPPRQCCGHFAHKEYWKNCEFVPTQIFTQEDKKLIQQSNYDPFFHLDDPSHIKSDEAEQ